MSNEVTSTTTAASVTKYTGNEKAAEGFRVVAVHYKKTDDRPIKPDSMVAIVPCITIASCEPVILHAAMQSAVNDLQDALVRKLIDTDKLTLIPHDSVSASAVAAYSLEQASSKRLDKVSICGWFDASLSDKLTVAISAKLGITADKAATDEQLTKIAAAVSVYRDKLQLLAMPKPAMDEDTAKNLLKAIAHADDSSIKQTLSSKLDILSKPLTVEMMAL